MSYEYMSIVGPWISLSNTGAIDQGLDEICSTWGLSRTYKSGDVITRIGEKVNSLSFLNKGSAASIALSKSGLEKIIFIYSSPSLFNEPPSMLNLYAEMEVRALTDCMVTFFDWDDLDDLLMQNKVFNKLLLRNMAKKIHSSISQVIHVLSLSPAVRICGLLLRLAEIAGVYNKGKITIKVSQTYLATLSGLHRVTVSRVFSNLKRRGIIAETGRSTVVLNAKNLDLIDDL